MTLDKNAFPYYDDFNPDKKYLQMLFNPGRAVQARELSQLQSIIQNQVATFGTHIFKEGSMVIPGEISLDTQYYYIKLEDQFDSNDLAMTTFENKKIVGVTSKTIASVLQTVAIEGLDPNTLYLKIETGSSSRSFNGTTQASSAVITGMDIDATTLLKGTTVIGSGIAAGSHIIEIISSSSVRLNNPATIDNPSVALSAQTGGAFEDGEDIMTVEDDPLATIYSATIQMSDSNSNATGLGSKAQIKRGIYFVRGYFCIVDDQVLLLDKYSNTPSYQVGLTIVESFVDASEDISLNDPAGGTPNFNAPGADRYKIELRLTKVEA